MPERLTRVLNSLVSPLQISPPQRLLSCLVTWTNINVCNLPLSNMLIYANRLPGVVGAAWHMFTYSGILYVNALSSSTIYQSPYSKITTLPNTTTTSTQIHQPNKDPPSAVRVTDHRSPCNSCNSPWSWTNVLPVTLHGPEPMATL